MEFYLQTNEIIRREIPAPKMAGIKKGDNLLIIDKSNRQIDY